MIVMTGGLGKWRSSNSFGIYRPLDCFKGFTGGDRSNVDIMMRMIEMSN